MGMPPARPGLYSAATGTPNAQRMTKSMENSTNPEFVFMGNANVQHEPKFYVRIFNVGELQHLIERPWVSYNPAHHSKVIVIPPREKSEKYSKPFLIADVVQIPIKHISVGEIHTNGVDGKFLAQDAIHPEDPRGNWRSVRPYNAGTAMNEGTNLYRWGVFWTINDQPTDEELAAAYEKKEANYNRLIEEAKMFHMGGAETRKQIGFTHRLAASYYGLEFEWNQLYTERRECPGCGSNVKASAVICPQCPAVFDWTKAVALGLRTVKQAKDAGILFEQAEAMGGEAEEPEDSPVKPKKKK